MLKKSIIFSMLVAVLAIMAACSNGRDTDNKGQNKQLTYKEEVEEFGNKLAAIMNAKEYEKICEYWSQAYIKLSEKQKGKTYAELKKDYIANVSKLNGEDISVDSINIIKVTEKERVYSIVMSLYCYNAYNERCYAEEMLYVFKEGDKLVFSDNFIPIEKVIKLSKDEYDFSSPVSEDE